MFRSLNRLLAFGLAARIDKRLRQAGMDIKVGDFVLLSLPSSPSGLLIGDVAPLAFCPGVYRGRVLLFVLPSIVVNVKGGRRMKQFISQFPDALEMFARSLRAGHSFTGAIQLVAQEMPHPARARNSRRCSTNRTWGSPLRQALIEMTERIDSLDVKFFVTAILIQRETGGNLAEIIDKISYVIRERFRVQGQLKIFTAQARLTGIILSPPSVASPCVIWSPEPGLPEAPLVRQSRETPDRHRGGACRSRGRSSSEDRADQDLNGWREEP